MATLSLRRGAGGEGGGTPKKKLCVCVCVCVVVKSQGLNAALYFENKDPRTFVSLVPTSAHSGDGCGNLIGLLVDLTQTMLARRLAHCDELRAQVMEVRPLERTCLSYYCHCHCHTSHHCHGIQ